MKIEVKSPTIPKPQGGGDIKDWCIGNLEFVLGCDVQLPLESARSLFSYALFNYRFALDKLKDAFQIRKKKYMDVKNTHYT